jgi:hypothetical protein
MTEILLRVIVGGAVVQDAAGAETRSVGLDELFILKP